MNTANINAAVTAHQETLNVLVEAIHRDMTGLKIGKVALERITQATGIISEFIDPDNIDADLLKEICDAMAANPESITHGSVIVDGVMYPEESTEEVVEAAFQAMRDMKELHGATFASVLGVISVTIRDTITPYAA